MIRGLAGAIVLLFVLGLLTGGSGFGWPDLAIIAELRLPRSVLALLIGGGLGLSGAVLQGALRNPLADAGLLGIAGCAGLGAVVAFYWGISAAFAPALPLVGLAGAGIGCAALVAAAGRAPDDRSLLHLGLAAPPILAGAAVLLRTGPGLDALALGEDVAASLGRPAGATLRATSIGVALAVGAGAAVAGGIGFVGLIVPHLLRPWLGERPGALLPAAALAGAALLLAADIAARALPLLLRLGVITALLGAPLLIRIALRSAS